MLFSHTPQALLALRLRALREDRWPGRKITQPQLALALGVSVPLISSWESAVHPRVPPASRLDSYAVAFASERLFNASPLSRAAELSDEERRAMVELRTELRRLRADALKAVASDSAPRACASGAIGTNPWRFDDGGPITIVCAQLPPHMLAAIPCTRAEEPDYTELLSYSELDALFELHGHLRAANPESYVRRRVPGRLQPTDYQGHLVVLGGTERNLLTRTIMERLRLPVRVTESGPGGVQHFEVEQNGTCRRHRPVLSCFEGQDVLEEDVALFARALNPWNRQKTVTLCYGMYGRGTYGAIRALTDIQFRDRNTAHIQSRFADSDAYCVLTRVPVIDGETLTPDWTTDEHTLFEWSRSHDHNRDALTQRVPPAVAVQVGRPAARGSRNRRDYRADQQADRVPE